MTINTADVVQSQPAQRPPRTIPFTFSTYVPTLPQGYIICVKISPNLSFYTFSRNRDHDQDDDNQEQPTSTVSQVCHLITTDVFPLTCKVNAIPGPPRGAQLWTVQLAVPQAEAVKVKQWDYKYVVRKLQSSNDDDVSASSSLSCSSSCSSMAAATDSESNAAVETSIDAGVETSFGAKWKYLLRKRKLSMSVQDLLKKRVVVEDRFDKVKFFLKMKLVYGQNIYLLGEPDELGGWNTVCARRLTWNPGDIWDIQVAFRNSLLETPFQYKVLVSRDYERLPPHEQKDLWKSVEMQDAVWGRDWMPLLLKKHTPVAQLASSLVGPQEHEYITIEEAAQLLQAEEKIHELELLLHESERKRKRLLIKLKRSGVELLKEDLEDIADIGLDDPELDQIDEKIPKAKQIKSQIEEPKGPKKPLSKKTLISKLIERLQALLEFSETVMMDALPTIISSLMGIKSIDGISTTTIIPSGMRRSQTMRIRKARNFSFGDFLDIDACIQIAEEALAKHISPREAIIEILEILKPETVNSNEDLSKEASDLNSEKDKESVYETPSGQLKKVGFNEESGDGDIFENANIRYSGKSEKPDASVRTKRLHWTKLNKKLLNGSLWETLEHGTWNVDYGEIIQFFGVSNLQQNLTLTENNEQNILVFLKPSQARNIAITLNRLKHLSFDEIVNAFLNARAELFTEETLELVASILPEPTEVKEIQQAVFSTSKPVIDLSEVFLMKVGQVPLVKQKAESMLLRLRFEELKGDIVAPAEIIIKACCQVMAAKKLHMILEFALAVGNAMNLGTPKGEAKGFSVLNLPDMASVVSSGGRCSLLHYIAAVLRRSMPALLKFDEQISFVNLAANTDTSVIESRAKEMKSKIEHIQKEVNNHDNDLSSQYVKVMSECVKKMEVEYELEVDAVVTFMNKKIEELTTFLPTNNKKGGYIQEFFCALSKFIGLFKLAIEESGEKPQLQDVGHGWSYQLDSKRGSVSMRRNKTVSGGFPRSLNFDDVSSPRKNAVPLPPPPPPPGVDEMDSLDEKDFDDKLSGAPPEFVDSDMSSPEVSAPPPPGSMSPINAHHKKHQGAVEESGRSSSEILSPIQNN